ncbi:MAG: hypothetical protein EYC62_09245 [Alphaproteobacteria bacterium]|nr:MAG: hypothetical protein EYC62_09245 [Alphaproteobacteria bacterium]
MQYFASLVGKINSNADRKPANAGFGVVAMIIGLIALLSISVAIATYTAQQDQVTADETTQGTSVVQQAEIIRNVIRRCAARMNSGNVTATQPVADQPYLQYPGCKELANDDTAGSCSLGSAAQGGAVLSADLKNIWCEGTNKYAFDTNESAFNLKSVSGFSRWTYQKVDGNGVFAQIQASADNSHFAAVLSQVRAAFPDNELTPETIVSNNNNQIGVYIYRGTFPGDGGGGGGGNNPNGIPNGEIGEPL